MVLEQLKAAVEADHQEFLAGIVKLHPKLTRNCTKN
jgi:hypothetical protein